MSRPAGKAFARYGADLNVEKFGNALGDVDNEIERKEKALENAAKILASAHAEIESQAAEIARLRAAIKAYLDWADPFVCSGPGQR